MGLVPRELRGMFAVIFSALLFLTTYAPLAAAQSTGRITGKVTDPKNAPVADAQITVMNRDTGRTGGARTASDGTFTTPELPTGDYAVKVTARGFRTARANVALQENVPASVNLKLELPAILVNTEQPGLQRAGSFPQEQTLPLNGRNILESVALEPGIQLVDAAGFDAADAGLSSVSLGSRTGRGTRFNFDHIDLTNELVGGPVQNAPLGAIEEFAMEQSIPDPSNPLGAAGAVNLVTRSGTDSLHGLGFYNFRDRALDARLPGASKGYFQRNQYGGNLGGAIVPGKFFFFADVERTKQDLAQPVLPLGPFANLAGAYSAPYRDTQAAGRMDWTLSENSRAFYRFSYEEARSIFSPLSVSFQPFRAENHTPSHVVGLDFASGEYVHTFRFGYTRFHNEISNAAGGISIADPVPGVELGIGADPFCQTPGVDKFCAGPNYLAPQTSYQSNLEFKYDGSKFRGAHDFRFGAGYNRIDAAVSASLLGAAPAVGASLSDCARYSFCIPTDPTTYPVVNAILGSGLGAFSEKSAFGLSGAGLPIDNRLSGYVGDIWKLWPNLTVKYGVSYVRDTGRTDSDLHSIPALDAFGPRVGNPVNQPNRNFAPQLGVAWDPGRSAKTVFRAGMGLFYDNSAWNSALFDRAGRLAQGAVHAFQPVCVGGITPPGGIPFPDGSIANPTFCGQPAGSVAAQITALQQQYQSASAAAAANAVYAGSTLADGINATGTRLFYPNYVTPRSVQMNLGLEHELHEGVVLSFDYLRNVGTHILESVDTNRVGSAGFLDRNAALAAISSTNNSFGCGPGTAFVDIDCAISNGATLTNFAGNGLDSANTFCFGLPCSTFGARAAAFPGTNSSLGTNQMLFPLGRSVYNSVQLAIKQESREPLHGVRYLSWQLSYAFSKYVSTSRDDSFASFATDNNDPLGLIGPNALDRRHQLSLSSTVEVPKNFRLSFVGHFYSPLSQTLTLDPPGAGSIFVTDVTGDGTDGSVISSGGIGDVLPGTNIGAFDRRTKPGKINTAISYYDTTFAGKPTPAGEALLNAGLFNLTELQEIGAVLPNVTPAPATQAPITWLKDFDLSLSWARKIGEHVELRPEVSAYNIFNVANFNGPANLLSGVLDATPGSVNGTPGRQPNASRIGLGSGVFALGAPRTIEFTLKISF